MCLFLFRSYDSVESKPLFVSFENAWQNVMQQHSELHATGNWNPADPDQKQIENKSEGNRGNSQNKSNIAKHVAILCAFY